MLERHLHEHIGLSHADGPKSWLRVSMAFQAAILAGKQACLANEPSAAMVTRTQSSVPRGVTLQSRVLALPMSNGSDAIVSREASPRISQYRIGRPSTIDAQERLPVCEQ